MKDALPPFPPTRPPAEAPTRPIWTVRPARARPPAGAMAVVLALALSLGVAGQEPQVVERDLDRDGVRERLVSRPGRTEIEVRDPATGEWKPAGFGLPEGVSVLDTGGADAGLRWVDLNGDGFDDVLFSNDQAYGIHLWTKNVQPQLGWTRGWSQLVRAGSRKGTAGEPPSVAGAVVTLEDGQVVIRHPGGEGRPARVERVAARELIDVRMPPPRSPAEALALFRVRPGFRVELAAAEPVVVDPVAFDWGPDGRLWVVEMRDYPLGMDGRGRPGGMVRVLADDDGDGRYERATTFLEGLPFPTSVMAWGKGVLVAAAPDLLYAEDTDGDGRADWRRVLFTGFHPGNQQHRFNGFEWGLDGWVYAANGDSGGTVRSLATGRSVSISGRDLRFRPDTGELEAVSAQTQFGRRRDDWGNWFGNNNPAWLWHVTVPEHYLRRNPRLAVRRVTRMLANYPESTRVFPSSPAQVRPNQPWSLNQVTSGCSPTPYRDDLFGAGFAASVFISEPVHNVVHREVLEPDGGGLASRRAAGEEQAEFLASADPWFRPTTLRVGPDGALWMADLYRFVLEHPEWISPEMQARLDLRAGSDRGRLYRVVPEGRPRRPIPDLSGRDTAGLVAALDSPGGWQRDMAMRLLVERRDPGAGPALRELLGPARAPQVRVQALATLGLLGGLDDAALLGALEDPHPAVRAEALRQAESRAPAVGAVFDAVVARAADPEAAVRRQAAFSLGAWPAGRVEPVLGELAGRDGGDETTRIAIQSSLPPASPLFARLQAGEKLSPPAAPAAPLKPASPDRAAVVQRYLAGVSGAGDAPRGQAHFERLCSGCHRFRGRGTEVGPDLDMAAGKPVEWLVAAILDPNQAVEARYRAWQATLADGGTVEGLLAAETANNLVLRQGGGAERVLLRADLKSLAPTSQSMMPAGFESALGPADLADLLAWLRRP